MRFLDDVSYDDLYKSDQNNDTEGGFISPEPGRYAALIQGHEDGQAKTGTEFLRLKFACCVQNGSEREVRCFWNTFWLTEKSVFMGLFQLCKIVNYHWEKGQFDGAQLVGKIVWVNTQYQTDRDTGKIKIGPSGSPYAEVNINQGDRGFQVIGQEDIAKVKEWIDNIVPSTGSPGSITAPHAGDSEPDIPF